MFFYFSTSCLSMYAEQGKRLAHSVMSLSKMMYHPLSLVPITSCPLISLTLISLYRITSLIYKRKETKRIKFMSYEVKFSGILRGDILKTSGKLAWVQFLRNLSLYFLFITSKYYEQTEAVRIQNIHMLPRKLMWKQWKDTIRTSMWQIITYYCCIICLAWSAWSLISQIPS